MSNKTKVVGVRLSEEDYKEYQEIAENRGYAGVSGLVRYALNQLVKQFKDEKK